MKKGFTLVELLVVIALIGLLIAIAVPSGIAISNKIKKSMLDSKIELIESGAIEWGQKNKSKLLNGVSACTIEEIVNDESVSHCLSKAISDLLDENALEEDKVIGNKKVLINPVTNMELNNCNVEIYIKNKRVYAKYDINGTNCGYKKNEESGSNDEKVFVLPSSLDVYEFIKNTVEINFDIYDNYGKVLESVYDGYYYMFPSQMKQYNLNKLSLKEIGYENIDESIYFEIDLDSMAFDGSGSDKGAWVNAILNTNDKQYNNIATKIDVSLSNKNISIKIYKDSFSNDFITYLSSVGINDLSIFDNPVTYEIKDDSAPILLYTNKNDDVNVILADDDYFYVSTSDKSDYVNKLYESTEEDFDNYIYEFYKFDNYDSLFDQGYNKDWTLNVNYPEFRSSENRNDMISITDYDLIKFDSLDYLDFELMDTSGNKSKIEYTVKEKNFAPKFIVNLNASYSTDYDTCSNMINSGDAISYYLSAIVDDDSDICYKYFLQDCLDKEKIAVITSNLENSEAGVCDPTKTLGYIYTDWDGIYKNNFFVEIYAWNYYEKFNITLSQESEFGEIYDDKSLTCDCLKDDRHVANNNVKCCYQDSTDELGYFHTEIVNCKQSIIDSCN